MNKILYFNKNDLLILTIILSVAIVIYSITNFNSKNFNEIYANIIFKEIVKTISLKNDQIFSIEQLPNIEFQIKNNSIRFLKSDCLDQICVNTSFINKHGQTAICLPNKIMIKIVDKNVQNNIDTIIK